MAHNTPDFTVQNGDGSCAVLVAGSAQREQIPELAGGIAHIECCGREKGGGASGGKEEGHRNLSFDLQTRGVFSSAVLAIRPYLSLRMNRSAHSLPNITMESTFGETAGQLSTDRDFFYGFLLGFFVFGFCWDFFWNF